MAHDLALIRSWLFTPASRPDRFARALESGADAVILDLEDAVAEDAKEEARANVLEFLRARPAAGPVVVVRVNAIGRAVGLADLVALSGLERGPQGILLPKTELADVVRLVSTVLDDARSDTQLAALMESACGIARVEEIAAAGGRLRALMFGAADYAADLGQKVGTFDADHARARLVNAAASAGLAAIDAPFFAIGDTGGLGDACETARRLGFFGKAAIHPAHVAAIRDHFAPSPEDIAEARRIIEAASAGVGIVEGRMVDEAMVKWARRIIG